MASIHAICLLILAFCFIGTHVDARIRFKYRKRPECRSSWPRRIEDLPSHVVIGTIEKTFPVPPGATVFPANVQIKWVIRGKQQLEGQRVTIDGFEADDSCFGEIKKADTLILLLEPVTEGLLRLNGTIIRVNLNNLDRIQAIIADSPFRRRVEVIEQSCETHYCPYSADCVEDNSMGRTPKCVCPTNCPHAYEPVCGSDGETYNNACRLRMDTCLKAKNVFIRYPGVCEPKRRVRSYLPASFYDAMNIV